MCPKVMVRTGPYVFDLEDERHSPTIRMIHRPPLSVLWFQFHLSSIFPRCTGKWLELLIGNIGLAGF